MEGERWYAPYVVKKLVSLVILKISMTMEGLRAYTLPIARNVEKN